MVATGFLSMWVSNTATAMMMLPIGQSLVRALTGGHNDLAPKHVKAFGSALMLGIAYSATIGGMGTLIGTPPNALFASFMAETYGIEVSFAEWMLIGIPVVLILLPMAWLVLTRVAFSLPRTLPGLTAEGLDKAVGHTGRMTADETRVAILLLLAAAGWVLRPLLEDAFPWLVISDAGIAIAVAIALFLLPSRSSPGRRLLSWDEARNIRWDVLILFGGGLALAQAIAATGLASWIGSASSVFAMLPWLLLLLLVMAVIVLLGELASNTAVAAVFLPVAGAAAVDLGSSPLLLSMSVALAASLGFMLPVATPPNAILYGSGAIKSEDMLRAGIMLDVLGIVIVALLVVGIGGLILGP
jgi:sodium-dependent dicarboxylate transporter 2/3/5